MHGDVSCIRKPSDSTIIPVMTIRHHWQDQLMYQFLSVILKPWWCASKLRSGMEPCYNRSWHKPHEHALEVCDPHKIMRLRLPSLAYMCKTGNAEVGQWRTMVVHGLEMLKSASDTPWWSMRILYSRKTASHTWKLLGRKLTCASRKDYGGHQHHHCRT